MRGKKAKRLRKIVYGDYSHQTRNYVTDGKGTIKDTGRRRIYQSLKRSR